MKLVLGVLALVTFAQAAIAEEAVVVNQGTEATATSTEVASAPTATVRPAEQAVREIARHRRHRRHRHHRRHRRHHRRW